MSLISQHIPITINGRAYYFKNIAPTDDSGPRVFFYVKVKKKKTTTKRKYFFGLLGPVLWSKTEEIEELEFAFQTFKLITELENYNVDDIKNAEELYYKKCQIIEGRLTI